MFIGWPVPFDTVLHFRTDVIRCAKTGHTHYAAVRTCLAKAIR